MMVFVFASIFVAFCIWYSKAGNMEGEYYDNTVYAKSDYSGFVHNKEDDF